jgi:hypothetical protein
VAKEAVLTREEAMAMMERLKTVVGGELESELINSSHTSLLLFRQLCGQV